MSALRGNVATLGLVSVFIIAVSASVTEKLLQVSLFRVGELWISACTAFMSSLVSLITTVPDFTCWNTYLYLSLTCAVGYFGYKILFTPLNRVRKLGDVGYVPEGSWNKKEVANMVRKRRQVGEIPPVYPNGWFGLMESWKVQVKEAVNVSVLGLDLAVFRDEKGEVHALNAYCPHMGANLAAGGRVFGDNLECPYHAWRFRGDDGKCTHIPYTDKIPDIAKVKSWPVTELNGWIYLWHHAEGIDPAWMLPELEEISNGSWTYRGRSEHIINAHIEEIPENGADVVHLGQVHGSFIGAGIDLRHMWNKLWGFAKHEWNADWQALPSPDGHIGQIKLQHSINMFGIHIPPVDLNISAQQIGPGVVYLEFTSMFGKGVFIQSLTPVEPMVQKLVHNIYVHWTMPTFIAKFFMFGEAIQVERDVMIWNNKRYEGRPMFVKSKEDSLIAKHRRWYSQFYSKNSRRLIFQKENLDW
ncbi:cholesterol 7-desaturase nvd-like [Haliotis rufescens]|uniref:cholesterol 7-desaturase nvd-like n=1 Tax=Haliotis rufescens TaxID=6454 RepID=UPI001EB0786E|nr:cholesterol 7-desaturase nvd-like [Haliotis rufescens]